MAIPPDPIEEVLPDATWVVIADVSEVISTDPELPRPQAVKGDTSVPYKLPRQVLKLKVTKTLRGSPPELITVEKPVGAYVLKAGNAGPFLLKEGAPHAVILGRYGPDSYALSRIEAALRQR